MNSLGIAALSCGALYLGYLLYGRLMARLWEVQPERKTPALERADGVDYVAAKHWTVLFGHHFASIAGAIPIVGPVWACAMWGWLPGLFWIVLGSVFMGGVHDFSALMASVRAGGRSIAEIAEGSLGQRARLAFGGFLWLALVLVVAVFAHLGGQSLATMPQVVIPTFGVIVAAIVVGVMMYRWRVQQWLATIVGLGILFGLLIVGYFFPVLWVYPRERVGKGRHTTRLCLLRLHCPGQPPAPTAGLPVYLRALYRAGGGICRHGVDPPKYESASPGKLLQLPRAAVADIVHNHRLWSNLGVPQLGGHWYHFQAAC